MAQTVLITGASRGIGLALTQEYLQRGAAVLATCRRPASAGALRDLAAGHSDRCRVIELDVDSAASASAAADQADTTLDLLINNAAIGGPEGEGSVATLDVDAALATLRTNTLGPLRVAQAMRPLLAAGTNPRLVNISSGLGQMTGKTSVGSYIYGASKAALNFVTLALAAEWRPAGVTVVAMSPGWVRTDMGGADAPLSPASAAAGIATVIDRLTLDDTGQWFSHDGSRSENW